jgi:hypothetical protein
MKRLATNTQQRNILDGMLKGANNKAKTLQEKHIETLGRLHKYEGSKILEEIFDFAVKNSMMIHCNSAVVGVKTTVAEYISKKGKLSMAHYTVYGHYLGSVRDMGEEPVYYNGNFSVKEHKAELEERINYVAKDVRSLEDIFDLDV